MTGVQTCALPILDVDADAEVAQPWHQGAFGLSPLPPSRALPPTRSTATQLRSLASPSQSLRSTGLQLRSLASPTRPLRSTGTNLRFLASTRAIAWRSTQDSTRVHGASLEYPQTGSEHAQNDLEDAPVDGEQNEHIRPDVLDGMRAQSPASPFAMGDGEGPTVLSASNTATAHVVPVQAIEDKCYGYVRNRVFDHVPLPPSPMHEAAASPMLDTDENDSGDRNEDAAAGAMSDDAVQAHGGTEVPIAHADDHPREQASVLERPQSQF